MCIIIPYKRMVRVRQEWLALRGKCELHMPRRWRGANRLFPLRARRKLHAYGC
jgi:hypothetical protein